SVPSDYKHASYPRDDVSAGTPIRTLGDLKTDSDGRLIVLGGYGNAGGNEPLTSYGGSDTWHDDISDGPVYCTITFKDKSDPIEVQAWIIVGSPDFAPEIVNISTLSDSMFDVAVQHFSLVPKMYNDGDFNTSYKVNYQRDILPIIQRISGYQWVANVQSMMAFTSNIFDFSDPSTKNKANRENYFSYFRKLDDKSNGREDQSQQQLFKENGDDIFPMMPLNSGSNSVSNETIVKFLALDNTQYFMLSQWANGSFENKPNYTPFPVSSMDQASVGNCVGLPMCPGIEVTWSLQNPKVYSSAYTIWDEKGPEGYNRTGLTPSRDECDGGGCQPGDLTKRMACPWQADFFQCTVQLINFTNSSFNKALKVETEHIKIERKWLETGISYTDDQLLVSKPVNKPLPPTYYSYWWPPQSPWDVITGDLTLEDQQQSHLPAGQQMNYARGINSFTQMVEHWSALAFIRNNNAKDEGFPYFTETERTNELFSYKEIGVGQVSGNGVDDETTIPVFFIDPDIKRIEQKGKRGKKLVSFLEERAFKRIKLGDGGLGLPRSGVRVRR
ncbi:MAG: CTQ-dependent lysine 6-oxidase LodA, partial [Flavobacteriales bacterium]|nr:CTQ-dependent lysine 6-oxidase LodA [Flavobacteriales bacterium]